MKLTKPQMRALVRGLYMAIDWESSLIDAHKTDYAQGKDERASIQTSRRNIKAFTKLREQALSELSK